MIRGLIMRFVIYGSGQLQKRVYEYILGVRDSELCGTVSDSVEGVVFSEAVPETRALNFEELGSLYSAGGFDALVLAADNAWLSFIVRRLKSAGISDICYIPWYYSDERENIEDDSFIWIDTSLPRLEYVEYHVSWHCNLKCRGCSHFSNIMQEEVFGDPDRFGKDLIRLQELFWGIYKFRLMGGEPLLNPQLPYYIRVSRMAFPDADIRVVSNGLLIRSDMEDLFEAMRDCHVGFDISMYPPTESSIGRIDDICRENGVMLYVTPGVNEFYAHMDPSGSGDPEENYDGCISRHCAFLGDGVISTCGMPQWISCYNRHFGKDIPVEDGDIIDLYEEGLDGNELLKRLRSPMMMCRFCSRDYRKFEWKPAGPDTAQISDWNAAL